MLPVPNRARGERRTIFVTIRPERMVESHTVAPLPWSDHPAPESTMTMKRPLLLILRRALARYGCFDQNKGAALAQKRQEGLVARKNYLERRLDATAKKSVPDGFYDYWGLRDWYRMPLVFPYELQAIDTTDILWLHRHNGKGPVSDPNRSSEQVGRENPNLPEIFSRLSMDDSMLLFQSSGRDEFGLFLFSSGTFEFFASETDLFDAARKHGYAGLTHLLPASAFYDAYWAFEKLWIVIPATQSPAEDPHAESAKPADPEPAAEESHAENAESAESAEPAP